MSGILAGIDLGTTALKVAAFDTVGGTVVACASERLDVRSAADGTREQDLSVVREQLGRVFAAIRSQLGDRHAGIEGVGLAAQGGSGAIVNRESGTPSTPMLLWNDSRSRRHAAGVAGLRDEDFWQRMTRRRAPGIGLARLKWLRQTRPGLFTPDKLYVGAGEYVYFLLTGEWRQDACNALQIGCYNVPEDRLDDELLGLVGFDSSLVAPLRRGHERHPLSEAGASLLGLKAGIPVVGPYMDHEGGYLSAAAVSERPLQCSLGTAWVGNFVVPRDGAGSSPNQLVIPSPLAAPGRLVIQPLLTGNTSWDWGLATLLDEDHGRALAAAESVFRQSLLPPDSLLAVPWTPQVNPLFPPCLGGGTFHGIALHTTRADLLRALAAGMAYEFYRVLRSLQSSAVVDALVLGGGASKGWFFRRLLGALFAPLPLFALEDEEMAGARGAIWALDAGTGASRPVAVETGSADEAEAIRAGFERYGEIFERLYGHVPAGGVYEVG